MYGEIGITWLSKSLVVGSSPTVRAKLLKIKIMYIKTETTIICCDSMKELKKWANEIARDCPEHKEEILYFVTLCEEEIEQGGSIENEIHLCKQSILDLIID